MICTACQKKQAVVIVKTIVNNQVSEQALCADCAAQAGATVPFQDPFSALLGGLAGLLKQAAAPPPRAARCPCGMKFSDFRETGRMGCTECYKTFEAQVRAMLPKVHGGASRHRGKGPS